MHFRTFIFTVLLSCSAWGSDASPGGTPGEKSTDLSKDIKEMWRVTKLENENFSASSDQAISAANRVFNTIELKKLSKDEIIKTLRLDLRSPEYGYVAPFWPVKKGTLVLRFDSGMYGWQFNLYFDKKAICKKVERQWIH